MPSPCITVPANMTDCGALKVGFTKLEEEECLGLDEEIKWGNLRLQEIYNEKVHLREKSAMAEEEVKKLEGGMKMDFLDKRTVVIKQDAHDYIDKFGDYHRDLISLMPWIGPRITKRITNGGMMQMVKCMMQVVRLKEELLQGEANDDWVNPFTGGRTT